MFAGEQQEINHVLHKQAKDWCFLRMAYFHGSGHEQNSIQCKCQPTGIYRRYWDKILHSFAEAGRNRAESMQERAEKSIPRIPPKP